MFKYALTVLFEGKDNEKVFYFDSDIDYENVCDLIKRGYEEDKPILLNSSVGIAIQKALYYELKLINEPS
jgi:hypothetical protein